MTYFALNLAGRFLSRKHVWLCQLMCRFIELLDSEPLILSADAAEELKTLGLRFCDLYSDLAPTSYESRIKAWKGSPKLHMFQHMCEWQGPELGNPRFFWTYADEDMVGRMIKAARSCHPATLSQMTMWKWLLNYYELVEDDEEGE